ncbi:MAG: GMP/IMP nucleotidase [Pseudomonadota bacterium]
MKHNSLPLNWETIDTVLLDMDGTLLDLHFDTYFWCEHLPRTISQRDGRDFESTRNSVVPQLRAAIGTLEFYCIDYWSDYFSLDILALKTEVADRIALRDGAREFLDFLKLSRKTVLLTTNAHRATVDLKMTRTGLRACFDGISCSHELGYAKEHAAFWPQFREMWDIDYSRCLFIDDTPRVLRAAQAVGITQLLSITKPDSQSPPQEPEGFIQTNDFRELY